MTTGAETGAPGTVTLAPHPSSARTAREHVTGVLEAVPLPDLVDTAALLVSEVVTNAVLHAGTEIELSCRVDRGAVCVEVRDRSAVAPTPRHYDAGAMTGRGLGMVELLADRWGVDADEDGKTVWFEVGGAEAGAAGGRRAPEVARQSSGFDVCLPDLPVDLVLATVQYGDAVLRELVLLSIGSEEDPGPEGPPPASRIDLGPLLAEAEAAQAAGRRSVDLVLGFAEGAGAAALERLGLVDEADRLAREGSLLTSAAVPEIGLCRRWLFGEVARQEDGAAATAWRMPEPLDPVVGPARLPDAELRRLDALTGGAVVADDGNRILYVNGAAADLLGWERDELVGRRLASIVPPDLRSAHLAGFTRYLLTGEARILGQRIRLPALRRDGTIVEVDILIEMVDLGDRQVFRATLG